MTESSRLRRKAAFAKKRSADGRAGAERTKYDVSATTICDECGIVAQGDRRAWLRVSRNTGAGALDFCSDTCMAAYLLLPAQPSPLAPREPHDGYEQFSDDWCILRRRVDGEWRYLGVYSGHLCRHNSGHETEDAARTCQKRMRRNRKTA